MTSLRDLMLADKKLKQKIAASEAYSKYIDSLSGIRLSESSSDHIVVPFTSESVDSRVIDSTIPNLEVSEFSELSVTEVSYTTSSIDEGVFQIPNVNGEDPQGTMVFPTGTTELPEITSLVKQLETSTPDPNVLLRELQNRIQLERGVMFMEKTPMAAIDDTMVTSTQMVPRGRKRKTTLFPRLTAASSSTTPLPDLYQEMAEDKKKWVLNKQEQQMEEKINQLTVDVFKRAKNDTPVNIPVPMMPGYTSTVVPSMATSPIVLAPMGPVNWATKNDTNVMVLDIKTGTGIAVVTGLIMSGRL